MKDSKKVSVVIARFQTSALHEGHLFFMNSVCNLSDKIILFLGTTVVKGGRKNPLDFKTRELMVQEYNFPNVEIHPLPNFKNDDVWSKNLDVTIESLTNSNDNVILYGSRDCFASYYSGKFQVETIPTPNEHLNATEIRYAIGTTPSSGEDFRKGVIYASQNTYDKFYQAVDIAILNDHNEILLGRKPNETAYRFPGGFTDPNFDNSLESAAKREAMEECGNCEFAEFKYITSMRINDWRYRGSNDGIMTAFFKCKYIYGPIKASDDLEEVKWFSLDELDQVDIVSEHRILLEKLLNNITNG